MYRYNHLNSAHGPQTNLVLITENGVLLYITLRTVPGSTRAVIDNGSVADAALPASPIESGACGTDDEMRLKDEISMRFMLTVVVMFTLATAHAQDASLDAWRHADEKTRSAAIALARKAFDAYVANRTTIDPPAELLDLFKQRSGVFVSAMRNGAPRCCMGSLYPTEPNTALEIVASAVAAAGRDHRFPPIKPGELKGLTLIVSLVGPPHPIDARALTEIDPERDGLAVKVGDHYGVTLSGETGDVDRMVKWARIRAGAAKGSAVQLFRFEDVRIVEKAL